MADLVHLPTLVVVGAVAVAALVFKVYRVYSNPVSKLPGSELSKWTDLPWWSTFLRRNRVQTQHAVQVRYGAVARIAPNDVVVSDPEAIKQIFAYGSSFVKDKFYQEFTGSQEGEMLFSTVAPHAHQQRRRLLGYGMSESNLRNVLEPQIRRMTKLAARRMQDEIKAQGAVELLRWWFYMTTDVIGELTFGDSFRMLEQGQDNQYMKDIKTSAKASGLFGALPSVAPLLKLLPVPSIRGLVTARERSATWANESIQRYHKQVDADPANAPHTLFSKIWASHEGGLISDAQLSNEARSFLVAGTDTTAYTLTYLLYELALHPAWQRAILAEIASLPPDFASKQAGALPSLNKCIHETLRLHGPVQGSLPRVVPPQGLHAAGHFIPAGTVVHPQAYTLHRNAAIYPDPETWRPERWDAPTRAMNDNFLAWGGGSRVCLGKNLAYMELHLAIADFYAAFPNGIRVAPGRGTDAASMEHTQFFLSGPMGGACWVQPL